MTVYRYLGSDHFGLEAVVSVIGDLVQAPASSRGCSAPSRRTAPRPDRPLAAVCVFATFCTAAVSYTWMMLAVTVMARLLYGLLRVLNPWLFPLRVTERGVGAPGAALAVLLVLPVTTHAHRRLAPARPALRPCVHV